MPCARRRSAVTPASCNVARRRSVAASLTALRTLASPQRRSDAHPQPRDSLAATTSRLSCIRSPETLLHPYRQVLLPSRRRGSLHSRRRGPLALTACPLVHALSHSRHTRSHSQRALSPPKQTLSPHQDPRARFAELYSGRLALRWVVYPARSRRYAGHLAAQSCLPARTPQLQALTHAIAALRAIKSFGGGESI